MEDVDKYIGDEEDQLEGKQCGRQGRMSRAVWLEVCRLRCEKERASTEKDLRGREDVERSGQVCKSSEKGPHQKRGRRIGKKV